MTLNTASIIEGLLAGERRALARAISIVENREPMADEIMREIYPRSGSAFVLGVTGSPGVGKSTLISGLIQRFRSRNRRVGVVAVDPSSPFTGGAILGDRIRLSGGKRDPDVFFRSIANRGFVGGVSRATYEVLCLVDAAGFDVIILETVGAGQSEVEVMRMAHTVLVVLAPGLGDDIQAVKAGILEIGDVFVVNKADREGADRTVSELQMMLGLVETDRAWDPPVIKTIANSDHGYDELLQAIDDHRQYLASGDILRAKALDLAQRDLSDRVSLRLLTTLQNVAGAEWQNTIEAITNRRLTPNDGANKLLQNQQIMNELIRALLRKSPGQEGSE